MARTVFSIVSLLALIGSAVACAPYYSPANPPLPQQNQTGQTASPSTPAGQQNPPQSSSPSQTQVVQQSSLPLNIAIDYIGVVSAHNPRDYWSPDLAEVKLVVVINDGRTTIGPKTIPATDWHGMKSFDVWDVSLKGLHIDSATDYLRLSITAFDVDPNIDFEKSFFSALGQLGQSGATNVKTILDLLPGKWYLGDYENTWYPSQNWGIGPHSNESGSNLRVWFRIWSDSEQAPAAKPVLLPNVRIKSVTLPSTISLGIWGNHSVNHTLTLENNEESDIPISYVAYSSLVGKNFDSGTINLPKNSLKDISKSFIYDRKGTAKITYTIYYNNNELDMWSGEVAVIP
jgi:hypothetical protein